MTSAFSSEVGGLRLPPEDEGLGIWHSVFGDETGTLSKHFPEIEVTVHLEMGVVCRSPDRQLVSCSFQGKEVAQSELLPLLIKARGGWSREGGSSDEDIVATVDAYHRAWRAALDKNVVNDGSSIITLGANDWPQSHPPKTVFHDLDNGERIVCHSYFSSWDGGSHGTGYTYHVSAYHLADGRAYEIPKAGQPYDGPKPLKPLSSGGSHLN